MGGSLKSLSSNSPIWRETQPEIVARHFTEAGLPNEAVGYWLKAGQHATRLSSNLDAISHFERGLALLDLIEDSERACADRI